VSQTTGSSTTVYPNRFYSITTQTLANGTTTATSTDYVYAGSNLFATVDQKIVNGSATGTPITRYNHTDNLGSTNVTSDATMNVAQWFDYAPYGSVIATTNTGQTTAGRQFEGLFNDGTNLVYSNARYLNPSQGQFTTEDPVFWGPQQALDNPQGLNSYSYSLDNPITKNDPMGLWAFQMGLGATFWNFTLGGGIAVGTTDDGGYSFGPYLVTGLKMGAEVSGPQITTANLSSQYSVTTGLSASGGDGYYGVEISKGETYYPYSKKPPQSSQEATVGIRGGLGGGDITQFYVPLITSGNAPQGANGPVANIPGGNGSPMSSTGSNNTPNSVSNGALGGSSSRTNGNSFSQVLNTLANALQQLSTILAALSSSQSSSQKK
jgi:RHS repeat-associated protein